jgi:exodeoxyribonuclease VII small subunit
MFEDHLARLEAIAEALERRDVPLDEALRLFEEGIVRVRAAAETLDAAEGRLRELVQRADGSFGTTDGTPLAPDDDD